MSTRCSIVIRSSKNEDRKDWGHLYVHCDGYPEGVGADIRTQFTKRITNNSFVGNRYNKNDIIKILKDIDSESYADSDYVHSDVDYVYLVTITNSMDGVEVVCYKTRCFFNPSTEEFTPVTGYDKIYEDLFSPKKKETKKEGVLLEKLKGKVKELTYFELIELMETITEELKNK